MKRYYILGLMVLFLGVVVIGCQSQESKKPTIVQTLSENKYQTAAGAGWQEFTAIKGTLYDRYCHNGIEEGEVVLFECTNWEFYGGIYVSNP